MNGINSSRERNGMDVAFLEECTCTCYIDQSIGWLGDNIEQILSDGSLWQLYSDGLRLGDIAPGQ